MTEVQWRLDPAATVAVRPHEVPRELGLDLVVPAYNEQERITRTISALCVELAGLPLSARITVVDNGSWDRTADLVDRGAVAGGDQSVPVRVLGCSRAGKGAAVRRGILASSAKYIGFCDADLATAVEHVEDALAALSAGADVVIGSRYYPGAVVDVRQSRLRSAGGALFRRLTSAAAGGLYDTQCGFKFFTAAAAAAIFPDIRSEGFVFDLEVVSRALAVGLHVVEIPVRWSDQTGSTLRVSRDAQRIMHEIVQVRRMARALTHPLVRA